MLNELQGHFQQKRVIINYESVYLDLEQSHSDLLNLNIKRKFYTQTLVR